MRYQLVVRDGFAAAHRLVGSGGRCENLHGHNFKVELKVGGQELGEAGMLIDFSDLKGILRDVLSSLDHQDLNAHRAFAAGSPSSEMIAEFIFRSVEERIEGDISVISVTVSESDTASATYSG
ncbi:MAG: 6-carboxytetrahydropterin synthase QueD [bacterium]|nr:MAG: 6-carboxytetrahydropterin synthase QueD [bacterium]